MTVPDDHTPLPSGTYLFDGARSRAAYALNRMCMTLVDPLNRARFKEDEAAYCDGHGLTAEQKDAVLARDWVGMIRLGGNIYYVFKLAAIGGETMQHIGAQQNGLTLDQFRAKLNSWKDR